MVRSNLALRLITAAVAVPPLLLLLFRGPAWGFYLLVLLVALLGAFELFRMTHPGDVVSQGIGVAFTAAVSIALYLHPRDPRVLVSILVLLPTFGILIPLLRLGNIATAGLRIMAGVAGPLYIGASLTTLALLKSELSVSGAGWVVLALTFAWLADTGGYFFGRFLGKTKLYEAVSPKKTRAGFVGALVGASCGALAARFWFLPEINLAEVLPLAICAGALGQLGDLVESLLKRSTGIKDSGAVVPGHGGILDRIDALLVVAPLVYLYVTWANVPS
ncbi:MAG: phosphatidate cytidylyltransferase [Myxococcota bacterium]